jgi:hypothetical protein
MSMKRAAALIAASLAWTACSVAGPARPAIVELGKDFSLKPGESAQTADAAWQVGFEGVGADSRCPKGEQCVWAGEATVRVWLQQGGQTRQSRELRSTPGTAQSVRVGSLELRLLRVDPYPVRGKPIARNEYKVTLLLAPDRPGQALEER